jgi:hypothetical protein
MSLSTIFTAINARFLTGFEEKTIMNLWFRDLNPIVQAFLATLGLMAGFSCMMALDVAFGG